MDFLRALHNNQDPILDEDIEKLLNEPGDLDEDAMDRIKQRVKERERNFALYRFLVGSDKIMLTKKFLDLADEGKGIPSSIINAYKPIIDMVDDIVDAGPAFVQNFKTLHSRAKKAGK